MVSLPFEAAGGGRVTTKAGPALAPACRYASISEIAKAEGFESGYLGSLLRLTLLALGLVEAILSGRQPGGARVGV